MSCCYLWALCWSVHIIINGMAQSWVISPSNRQTEQSPDRSHISWLLFNTSSQTGQHIKHFYDSPGCVNQVLLVSSIMDDSFSFLFALCLPTTRNQYNSTPNEYLASIMHWNGTESTNVWINLSNEIPAVPDTKKTMHWLIFQNKSARKYETNGQNHTAKGSKTAMRHHWHPHLPKSSSPDDLEGLEIMNRELWSLEPEVFSFSDSMLRTLLFFLKDSKESNIIKGMQYLLTPIDSWTYQASDTITLRQSEWRLCCCRVEHPYHMNVRIHGHRTATATGCLLRGIRGRSMGSTNLHQIRPFH